MSQRYLIGTWLFPINEIAYVVFVSNFFRPDLICGQYGVINFKRKEFLSGDFSLLFDPGALKRMF